MSPVNESSFAILSMEDVCKLASISPERLRHWVRSDAFRPEYGRGGDAPAVYAFRDAVGLRVLALLRHKGVPLQQLRKVGQWLYEERATPWSSLRFFVSGRQVYFTDPKSGHVVASKPFKQMPLKMKPFDIEPVEQDMARKVRKLTQRDAAKVGTVERRRGVKGGSWVVGGTRISSESIWNFKQAGYGMRAILAEYPTLSEDDVRAAIEHEEERRRKKAS
jgi:uncharacterized protein (DUF433 family)